MEEFRVCISCEYAKGFHVSFRKVKGRVRICLICPNCGQSYEIGWSTASIKGFKIDKGASY